MRYLLLAVLLLALAGSAMAVDWPSAGQTYSVTVSSPNSQDGAKASLWGFYAGPAGWVNTTFGTGVFSGGSATFNYTVPADFVSDFYWNAVANYSTTSDERGQYNVYGGAWDQFFIEQPSSVAVSVYQFDQRKVTTRSASFRASVQGGTVFPPAAPQTKGWVSVRKPWTGTMAEYTAPAGGYYSNSKTSLLPTRLAAKGYAVEVLEGNPAATQEFQKIRLHNADDSYSVELFGYKNLSTDDVLGYLWWTTLVDVASADCDYDDGTGVFTGAFASPLDTGVMYFVVPEFELYDVGSTTVNSWIQAGRGTDLLLSGSSFAANQLSLDVEPASIYIQPGQSVTVDMNVSNLTQKVNACQAMLGYSSTYFANPTDQGAPDHYFAISPGGATWDQVIYDSWAVGSGIPGEIDTAVGVNASGTEGTNADGTVCTITLASKPGVEGTTQIWFRPDLVPDEGLVKSTFLSDMTGTAVWPAKMDSTNIIIDGTKPTVVLSDDHADAIVRDADTVVVTATFTEANGIDEATPPTITIAGGGVTNATMTRSSNLVWTYAWDVPAGDGAATVSISAQDLAGNPNTAATGQTDYTIDNTAPTVVVSDDHADAIVRDADTVVVTATFTEANGISEAAPPTISIANGGVTNAPMTMVSNLVWTYTWDVPAGVDAAAAVSISAADVAGNANTAATGKLDYTIDNTAPTVTINQASGQADPTKNSPINFTVVFSESVDDFDASDVVLSSGTAAVTGSGTTYNVAVSGMSDGTVTASIPADAAHDVAGNGNVASTSTDNSVLYDTTAPAVSVQILPANVGANDCALQGDVIVRVTVIETGSGLEGLSVTCVNGPESVPGMGMPAPDTYDFTFKVTAATPNGSHTFTTNAFDGVGLSTTVLSPFCVNKNEVNGQVQLEGYVGSGRIITFVATAGATTKTWTLPATGHITTYKLTDAPDSTTHVSAKTNMSLRKKLAVGGGTDNQWTADFTGAEPVTTPGTGNYLRGGDLNDSNSVNVLDYSILKVNWMGALGSDPTKADINGDGSVQLLDYAIMKANWFKPGDPQ